MQTTAAASSALRPVLVHDKSCLDVSSVGAELRRLCRPRPFRAWLCVAGDWAVIALAIVGARLVPGVWHWPAVALALAVIGGRQHALLILMHDAAHGRFMRLRRWNDLLSNVLLAWPAFVATESYRENHLLHHQHVNTEDDPDHMRKHGREEWEFPKTPREVFAIFARAFMLAEALEIAGMLIRMARGKAPGQGAKAAQRSPWPRLAYYAGWAVFLSLTGGWGTFGLYWLLPLVTFAAMYARIRSVCEHFGVEREHDLNHTRNYRANFLERATVAPHGIQYHLTHHLFPAIPFYALAEADRLLMTIPQYRDGAHLNSEVFSADDRSVLCDLLRGGRGNVDGKRRLVPVA